MATDMMSKARFTPDDWLSAQAFIETGHAHGAHRQERPSVVALAQAFADVRAEEREACARAADDTATSFRDEKAWPAAEGAAIAANRIRFGHVPSTHHQGTGGDK
jgi:hypothetical protein